MWRCWGVAGAGPYAWAGNAARCIKYKRIHKIKKLNCRGINSYLYKSFLIGADVCVMWWCVVGGLYRGSYMSRVVSELSSCGGVVFITRLYFALWLCVWYSVRNRGSYMSTLISVLSSYCGVLFITWCLCVFVLRCGGVCGMAWRAVWRLCVLCVVSTVAAVLSNRRG